MSKVVVIGGGAAGMFASIAAAGCGHQVVVYEKNEKLGKKLYITGKGRCNITNACDMEGLFDAVRTNAKFLYSSFYGYTNQQVIDFFERIGVPTKIERGDRVFPVSDHSSDVIRGLEREMDRLGVKVHLRTSVKKVVAKDGHFEKIILGDQRQIHADACIVATGGLSYQSTGSTGDGFRFAESLGHTVTDCMPALVPMECKEEWVPELQGLSLRNVNVTILDGKKKLYDDFGEEILEIKVGEYGVTEEDIRKFHAVDDHEVYINCKEMRVSPFETDIYQKWKNTFIKNHGYSPEETGHLLPHRQTISSDFLSDSEFEIQFSEYVFVNNT